MELATLLFPLVGVPSLANAVSVSQGLGFGFQELEQNGRISTLYLLTHIVKYQTRS